jgi:hypothetical protein
MKWTRKLWWLGLIYLILSGEPAMSQELDEAIQQGQVTLGGAWDVDRGQHAFADVLYWPEETSGIGVMVLDGTPGSDVQGEPVGPVAKFKLGDLISATLDAIFPGQGYLQNAPAQPFGVLSLLRDFDENTWLFATGTELVFFPKWRISPTFTLLYLVPEGNSARAAGFLPFVGARIRF